MPANAGVCTIVPLNQEGFRPIVFGMGFLIGDREIVTCAHVIVAALGKDWSQGPSQVRVCFPFSEGPLFMDGSVDRNRWFAPGPPLAGKPTDIAIIELQEDAHSSIGRAALRKHENDALVKIYGFRGKELPNGGVESHPEGEWMDGRLAGSLPGGRGQFDGIHGIGATIEKGFSGAGVHDARHDAIVGMIVEADVDKARKIAQFIDVPSLERAVGRALAISAQSDPLAEDSPETRAIRKATSDDCYKIKFLGGEGEMDKGYYRSLTIRGRRPDDQTEIAQAVEYLINETLRDQVGRLPGGPSLKRRAEESDRESWPIVSLDDRIREKCADERATQLRALLLTDDPGGGKSTTARNVAWRLAVRAAPFVNERRQPVYIRLRDWEKSGEPPGALASF
jgi:Trypsin-like peptidase domain